MAMQGWIKDAVLRDYSGLFATEELQNEAGQVMEKLWSDCVEQGVFHYSVHTEALTGEMPTIFREFLPFVQSMDDFKSLCATMPNILHWLPYNSTNDMWGYTHDIILFPLLERIKSKGNLSGILKCFEGFPVTVCKDCGKDLADTGKGGSHILSCECGYLVVC